MKTILAATLVPGLIYMLIAIAICAGLFLALRAIVLWYWKIDKLISNQEAQIRLLKELNTNFQNVKSKQPVA